jgi:hypothetical protein
LLLCCIKVVCKHQKGSGRPSFLLLVVCPSVKEKWEVVEDVGSQS